MLSLPKLISQTIPQGSHYRGWFSRKPLVIRLRLSYGDVSFDR